MEYANGRRLTPLYHENENPFERRLAEFRTKANQYYSQSVSEGETSEQKDARLWQKKSDFAHLKREAAHINTLGFICARMECYQKNNRAQPGETAQEARTRQKRLKGEAHHPSLGLERNMRAQGRPQSSTRHAAHHVVPGRGWTENANKARVHMHLLGIGINDADNGAWMERKKPFKAHHWLESHASAHRESHTKSYELWLWNKVQQSTTEAEMRINLQTISGMLEAGCQPRYIRYSPLEG